MTKICPLCGAPNPDNAKFCNKCGAPLEEGTVVCKVCGSKNPKDAEFCRVCGSPLKPITRLVKGRYRLLKMIGEGGFGRTYLATDELLFGRKVVLKEFTQRKKSSDVIMKEGMILAKLNHPLIPKIHGFFEDKGKIYLAQDYIEGKNLRVLLETKGRQTEDFVLKVLQDVLDTLAYLQKLDPPLVHRDIKPENLIISNGKTYLVDFGAVKELSKEALKHKTIIYTKGYVSPEQRKGEPALSSDIYSLGVVAIELLTGMHPEKFINKKTKEINYNVLSNYRQELVEFLVKMTNPDPSLRYKTAEEALTDLGIITKMATLRKFIQSMGISSSPSEEQKNAILKSAEDLGIPRRQAKIIIAELESKGGEVPPKTQGGISYKKSTTTQSKTFRERLRSIISSHSSMPVKLVGSLKAMNSKIAKIEFSEDGSLLATGSWNGVVKIYSTKSWQRLMALKASSGMSPHVLDVKLSPNARKLAAASATGEIRVWEVGTWLLAKSIKSSDFEANTVVFSQDEQFVFGGFADGSIKAWDTVTFNKIFDVSDLGGWVLRLETISRYLFAGTNNGHIYIWDIALKKLKKVLKEHDGWINYITFKVTTGEIISSTEDGELIIWSSRNLKPVWKGKITSQNITAITTTPDKGMLLFATGEDVHVFDMDEKVEISSFSAQHRVTAMGYAPHSLYFMTGDEKGTLKLWKFKKD